MEEKIVLESMFSFNRLISRYVTTTLTCIAILFFGIIISCPRNAIAQLPGAGVIFDDFEYTNTGESDEWCSEVNSPTTCLHPPAGSVYGANVWDTSQFTSYTQRMWYRHLWQEDAFQRSGTRLLAEPANNGKLTLVIDEGSYSAESVTAPPEQIISGFSATRGVWAAHVNFGDMEPASMANLIQAFWLFSPMGGFSSTKNLPEWNEYDMEWFNNASSSPSKFYLRTGHTIGDGTIQWPLFSPAWPDGIEGKPIDFLWSCKYIWGAYSSLLENDECVNVVNQVYVDSLGNTPQSDPWITLVLRVTDTGVFYEMESFGWGGIIVAHTEISDRVPDLEMATLFSQHIKATSSIQEDELYEIDWFYFTPDTTVDINDIGGGVSFLRDSLKTTRFNSTGLPLQRPIMHLPGVVGEGPYSAFTSPLTLDVSSFPYSMFGGETKRLLALPPNRSGTVNYFWEQRIHYERGDPSPWTIIEKGLGGWESMFTFPISNTLNVRNVEIKISVDELFYPHPDSIVNNSIVASIDSTKFILNADFTPIN